MGTDYDKETAEIYSEEMKVDRASLRPLTIEMIGEVKDLHVLDFGCGSGRFSKILAEEGAKVVAIDNSKSQIDLAKEINPHENISYKVGDENLLQEFDTESFDLILMSMVFPSMENKNQAENIFKDIKRVLKKEGKIIVSTLHPLYLHPIQKVNDRATDFDFKNYFNEGHFYNAEAMTTKDRIMHFRETHFSLNFISSLLEKNELCITKIRESKLIPELGFLIPVYIVFEIKNI
jgi:ubiquinone/menaquinone biosynthesis C-methylase UbiE